MSDGRQFNHERLQGAKFHGCRLAQAEFEDVDLGESKFTNVNLRGAKLADVNLPTSASTMRTEVAERGKLLENSIAVLEVFDRL